MNKQQGDSLSILFIVPSDYTSLLEKGVASMILERDERGFFKKVLTVHPYALKTQTLELNETHQLIEFGPDYPFSFLNFKLGKFVNYILKPLPVINTLIHLIRRNDFDVIRATDPFWCGFYAWAASTLTGIPFCISIHADYDKCHALKGKKGGTHLLFKIFERFVLPRARLVMPISEYLGRLVTHRGVANEKIRILPHGVNVEKFLHPDDFNLRSEFSIREDKKILCMVGRLSREKYIYDALEVARRLAQWRDDFTLIFVGDGEERDGLKMLMEKERLSQSVRIVGFQSNERVAGILSQSLSAFCLLAGFSLIEACVAGVPPVCYDIEWHTELIKNGENGFVVKEGDLEALTRAVCYFLDHPKETEEMGAKARELAMARHDLSYTSEVKRKCYRELLQHKVSSSRRDTVSFVDNRNEVKTEASSSGS